MPAEVDLWLGSPRDVLKNLSDLGFEPPKSPSSLSFTASLTKEPLPWLMTLVPDNTLLGSSDELPGLLGTQMPAKLADIGQPAPLQTVYAHNVRISSLVEVEQAFAQYIKDWRAFPQESSSEVAVEARPTVVERRLSVCPHNSWRVIGAESFVSLNREEGKAGNFHSSGSLKVLNFPVHPLIALVFKLEYRGNTFQ